MAGYKPHFLEVVGNSLFYGSQEVAVFVGAAATNGTLRGRTEGLLESARDDVVDEADHKEALKRLDDAHADETADLEGKIESLNRENDQLQSKVDELQALLDDVETDGAADLARIGRELGEAQAENDRLRAALKPFAEASLNFGYEGTKWLDHEGQWSGYYAKLTVGTLRAAHKALEKTDGK